MANDPLFIAMQSRGTFALPPDMRHRHGLDKPGAQVEVIERPDGVIELHPHIAVPQDQAWFWSAEWQQGEADVTAHVKAGRLTVSETPAAFFKDLERKTNKSGAKTRRA